MDNKLIKGYIETPLGTIRVSGSQEAVRSIHFMDEKVADPANPAGEVQKCLEQLDEYFQNMRREFTVKIAFEGTTFQKQVWEYLTKIPFGNHRSYMDIAKYLGDVKKIRAVGTANGANPLAIVVPCHRVIGSDGSLVGYAGGVWRKKWLLEHENPEFGRQLDLF